jgi:hypothetical protein
VRQQENSSFANFGRVLAGAVCKCAVLCVGIFHFFSLSLCSKNFIVIVSLFFFFGLLVTLAVWLVADYEALSYQVTTTFDTSCATRIPTAPAINYTACVCPA